MTNGVYKATTGCVLSRLEERFSVPIFQGLRRYLTKKDATGELEEHFEQEGFGATDESDEGWQIDSAFPKGKYDTLGESQLRTKIRSRPDLGRKFYREKFDGYANDG